MTAAHIGFWFVLLIIAIVNGWLRESTYGRQLAELPAHQLSTLLGIALTGLAFAVWTRWFRVTSVSQAVTVGGAWLAMTVAFEWVFGHFVAGHSWSRLLHDYNLFAGRVWPVFLVWIAALPWLGFRYGRGAG
jgi:hypothetical protein